MMNFFRRMRLAAVLLLALVLSGNCLTAVSAQTDDSQESPDPVQAMFDEMNISERVGQLFLVTFEGDTAVPESAI
ncbi:MAG: hypothetical protein P8183_08025, partial [Anaerolineae bacterium]